MSVNLCSVFPVLEVQSCNSLIRNSTLLAALVVLPKYEVTQAYFVLVKQRIELGVEENMDILVAGQMKC